MKLKKLSVFFVLLLVIFFVEDVHSINIEVSSEISLVDEPLKISITGLEPYQEIKLEAESLDSENHLWTSWAAFYADGDGNVFLDRTAPFKGTYGCVDAMGLFWSMDSNSLSLAFEPKGEEFTVEFKAYVGSNQIAKKSLTRLVKLSSIKKIALKEKGMVGSLFIPQKKGCLPVIIMLNGSSGGINEFDAKILASRGFAVLALGYFGMDGLPQNLENIPLEYFEDAFIWLNDRTDLDGSRIGIFGGSRGGELALLLGSVFPKKINAIVAGVPSSVIYGGSPDENKPAWIFQGKPVGSAAPIGEGDLKGTGIDKDCAISFTSNFLYYMHKEKLLYDAAAIKVEKIECPLLLISGGDDHIWPSSLYAEQIKQRLPEYRSDIECKHLSYPNAGHICFSIPFLPDSTEIAYNPSEKLWYSLGGTKKENHLASRDSWPKIIEFFKEKL